MAFVAELAEVLSRVDEKVEGLYIWRNWVYLDSLHV